MAKIGITKVTSSCIYKYVKYFHILFWFIEVIFDWYGQNDIVAYFSISLCSVRVLNCPTKWRLSVAQVGKMKLFKFAHDHSPKKQVVYGKNIKLRKIQDRILEILVTALLESIDLSLQFSMHIVTKIIFFRVRHISMSGWNLLWQTKSGPNDADNLDNLTQLQRCTAYVLMYVTTCSVCDCMLIMHVY